MNKKGIIIIGLLLLSICTIPFVIFSLQLFSIGQTDEDNGELPDYEPNITPMSPVTPILNLIVPNPTTNGIVELSWDYEWLAWFKIWRQKDDESWEIIKTGLFMETSYTDTITANGEYKYVIIAYITLIIVKYESDYSNVQIMLTNIPILPSNPSISINDGAETTDSYEVILTLGCDNADEMRFQIKEGYWTEPVDYTTTYPITLFEDDPWSPNYRVEVEFKNIYGTIKEDDDITYECDTCNGDGDGEIDYMLAFVLVGVLIGLIGIGIFLKYRKQIIKSK